MIHYHTETNPQGDHYAVGVSSGVSSPSSVVLVQVQQEGNQARIPLTVDEARHLANLLIDAANAVAIAKRLNI